MVAKIDEMITSTQKTCPACGVSLIKPKETTNTEGVKKKVGDGQEPGMKVILDPDDDPNTGFSGDDVIGFEFSCKRCTYVWNEYKNGREPEKTLIK
jgi:RNA polymerase subunit RPABC4/transcription elongation factor Spt4